MHVPGWAERGYTGGIGGGLLHHCGGVSVCLYVCMSVGISGSVLVHYLMSNEVNFLVALLLVLSCVCVCVCVLVTY